MPEEQLVQAADVDPEYNPALHFRQLLDAVAPVPARKDPAEQLLQLEELGIA